MRAALNCLKASPRALKPANPERPLVTLPALTSPPSPPSSRDRLQLWATVD